MWCRGTESNCRHQPFQGCALPTELPRHLGEYDRRAHHTKVHGRSSTCFVRTRYSSVGVKEIQKTYSVRIVSGMISQVVTSSFF